MACQPQCNPGTGEEWKGSCEHDRPLVVTLQKLRKRQQDVTGANDHMN